MKILAGFFVGGKHISTKYPLMASTARDCLAIPGAKVLVEWLCSSG